MLLRGHKASLFSAQPEEKGKLASRKITEQDIVG